MEKQLAILDSLYEEYNLESDEVVWNLEQRAKKFKEGQNLTAGGDPWLTAEWRCQMLSVSYVQNNVSMSCVRVKCFQWILNSTTLDSLGLKKALMSVF